MAVHEVNRDTPLPSPLTAEIVAVASPDSAKEADRLFITILGNFDALLRNIAFQNHVLSGS
jgi:hypothetical protein